MQTLFFPSGLKKIILKMKIIIVASLCFFCLGCANTGSLEKAYKHVIFVDGVDPKEAPVIARRAMIQKGYDTDYSAGSGAILYDRLVRDYPDYWFVSFDARKFEMNFWKYLVVIKKSDGEIIFAGAYVPLEILNYDWIFKNTDFKPQ